MQVVLMAAMSIIQTSIAKLATQFVKHVSEVLQTVLPVIQLTSSIIPVSRNALQTTSPQTKPAYSATIQSQLALNLLPSTQQPELKTIKV